DQNRLGGRGRRFLGDIDQTGAGGLGEDRNRIGHIGGKIHVAHIQRLKQRQAAGEFVPGNGNALLGQRLLQCSLTAQQRGQGGRLLKADADGGVCQGRAPQQQAGGGEQGGQQGTPATWGGAMGAHVLLSANKMEDPPHCRAGSGTSEASLGLSGDPV